MIAPYLGPSLRKRSCATLPLSLLVCCLIGSGLLAQEFRGVSSEASSIHTLVDLFTWTVKGGVSPHNYLLPTLPDAKRQRTLQLTRRQFVSLKIDYARKDMHFSDQTHARIRAYVTWATSDQSASYSATIRFEKVDGEWYFNDFDFLEPPLISEKMLYLLIGVFLAFLFVAWKYVSHRKSTSMTGTGGRPFG